MSQDKSLKIIPLGGLGHIGKNMLVVEYDDQLLIVDCGLMFPESDMLGIDIVIPDMSYVFDRADRVRAIVVTHGHEDHVGGLPYLLQKVKAPLYTTRLTRGLIEVKLREYHRIEDAELRTVAPHDLLDLAPFTVEFFHVCHSIPDAVGLAITTPVGLVVHSGDFKFDQTPIDGQVTDYGMLAELGARGVHVLLSDSTNADRDGQTPSEREVSDTFDRIFAAAPGRVIVATFASNISRVQQVVTTAYRHRRRVGIVGRSMLANAKMAVQLGYLDLGPEGADALLTADQMNHLPPEEVAIACTGSQGEPTSALVRMAMGEQRQVNIRPGDSVIVSATPIPGNEELVNRTVDNLFRAGAEVYYHDRAKVHVSGHASREEHKLLLNLIRPRFFVPVHGEYRHLVLHARMAEELGIPRDNIFVVDSGQVLEFGPDYGRVNGRVSEGHVLVDGLGVGDVGSVVLRDRHLLAEDGFVVAVVAVDADTGEVVEGPDIITRGFVYLPDAGELMDEAARTVVAALVGTTPSGRPGPAASGKIKDSLASFLYSRTRRRPMILPVVMEV
ncbi:MAG: ribonuclease J [Anaerolineae bacterium]|nr:ribonuclease J [Anaerolineae bacterium]